jgi:hypothetical protein
MGTKTRSRRVTDPSGAEWTVGRVWVTRPLPTVRGIGRGPGDTAWDVADWVPFDLGGLDDLAGMLVVVIGVVLLVFVLIPLLLFGIELILLGVVIAVAILGRVLLGRPWLVRAEPADVRRGVMTWEVSGWRRSSQAIDEIAAGLSAGVEPRPEHGSRVVTG